MTVRLYAAATGRCVAGNRRANYETQQRRVETDFAAGVRFALDRANDEARAFVPAYRRTSEAFVAAGPLESDDPLRTFIDEIKRYFDNQDGWELRSDSPEAALLEGLSGTEIDGLPETAVEQIHDANEQSVVQTPSYARAAAVVRQLGPSGGDSHTIVVSNDDTVSHVEWDVLLELSPDIDRLSLVR